MRIDQDAFEEWLAHPITEGLLRACVRWSQEAKDHWIASSWEGERPDPLVLARMRERALAFEQMSKISREQIEESA